MKHRIGSIRQVAKAALYFTLRGRHRRRRRLFLAFESFGVAVVIVLTTVLQSYFQIHPPTYKLDDATYSLIGESRDDTAQYLSENLEQAGGFKFAVPKSQDSGASEHTGRVADAYEVSLAKQARDGITVTETTSQITMTIAPKFRTGEGKKVDGDHIVYPMGASKLIYTLKYNGLKEDIVVPEYQSNSMEHEFELSFPTGVEARLDEAGNIGIYSSDPTLYGNISFGSDEDKAKVDKARENGQKTHLVATIPAPIVKDASGKEHDDLARFELGSKRQAQSPKPKVQSDLPAEVQAQLASKTTLNTYSLKIESKGLKDLTYPISIDPTFTITSAGDFSGLNYEPGAELDSTNNLIKRSSLSGGVTNTWSVATLHMSSARRHNCMFIMNGYIYIINGTTSAGTNLQSTEYKAIDSDGNITGSWSTTSLIPAVGACEAQNASTQYNGYLYIVGSTTSYYTKQNSNGTLQTWASTTGYGGINDTDSSHMAITINGYIYMLGGIDNGTGSTRASTGKAPINADGTIGAWASTTSLSTGVHRTVVAFYNSWLYVAGGYSNASGEIKHVQRVKVNADGTLGTWVTQSNVLTLSHHHASGGIFNGYLYLFGSNTGGANPSAVTEYTPILPDGSVGTVRATTNINVARFDGSAAALMHNGRIYISGGCSTGSGNCVNANTHIDTITYTTIKSAGELHDGTGVTWTSDGSISVAREGLGVVALNGYLYAIGGCGGTNCETESAVVDYAPINNNGTIGTWNTTTALPGVRARMGVAASGGYIYVVGGCTVVVTNACTTEVGTTYYAAPTTTGTISAWSTDSTNPLTVNRNMHAVTAYNGYLYVAGDEAGTSRDDVEYAQINTTDNSLNAWTAQTTALSDLRSIPGLIAHNGYLYVLGGNGTSGTSLTTIDHSLIGASGVPGSFSTTTSMGTARRGPMVSISNGYMYVTGGDTNNTSINTSEYTRINSNGTLNTWATTKSMTSNRARGGGVAHGGVLYAVGGWDSVAPGYLATVEYNFINNGGSGMTPSGTFTTSDNWNSGRFGHASVVYNGYMYIGSGRSIQETGCPLTCSYTRNISTVIEKGTINTATGNITGWANNSTAPDGGRYLHQMFAVNGYMFIIGGENNAGTEQNTVHSATIDPSTGNLGSWSALSAFPQSLSAHGGAVVGNTIYITGGVDGSGTVLTNVYYATVDSSGNLSSWTATTSLPAARRHHQTLINNNKLYAIGGINTDSTSDIYNDIIVADIAADGSVGTWRYAGAMPSKRHSFTASASNGYMYIAWGCLAVITITTCSDNSNALDDVQVAPMLAEGGVGTWSRTSYETDEGRVQPTSHIIGGRFYTAGGCGTGCGNGTDGIGDVSNRARYIGILQSIPRVGSFSKLFDLEVGVKPTKLVTRGTKQSGAVVGLNYANNNNAGTTFGTATSVTDQGFTGANALSIALGTNVTLSRYFFLRYIIDDAQSAVFPDVGNESTITDFDLHYTANPGKRLRGGRTFTNGADRGLDASP